MDEQNELYHLNLFYSLFCRVRITLKKYVQPNQKQAAIYKFLLFGGVDILIFNLFQSNQNKTNIA